MADCHLRRASPQHARTTLAQVRALIAFSGYGRRRDELQDTETAAARTDRRPSARLKPRSPRANAPVPREPVGSAVRTSDARAQSDGRDGDQGPAAVRSPAMDRAHRSAQRTLRPHQEGAPHPASKVAPGDRVRLARRWA